MTTITPEGILLAEDEEAAEWPTTIEWVDLADVVVDETYQRGEIDRHVEGMAYAFDKTLFGVPVLSKRADGTYAVLDGQQRLAALRLRNELGLDEVPIERFRAEAHHELDTREEALKYLLINRNRVRPSGLDQWKARLKFGDEVALAITALADEYGIPIGKPSKDHEKIGAPGTLEDIYTGYERRSGAGRAGRTNRIVVFREGPDALRQTFASITQSWGLMPLRYRSGVIAGLGLFFSRFTDEEIDYGLLHRTMGQVTPAALGDAAVREMSPSLGLESRRAGYAKTLALLYNEQAKREGAEPLPVAKRFPGVGVEPTV